MEKQQQAEEIDNPNKKAWWLIAFVATPVFLLIGLSVTDGFPATTDGKSWIALLLFTGYPIVAQTVELLVWRLRERIGRPQWWTSKHQNNLGQAVLLAGLGGGFWAWPDTSVAAWVLQGLGCAILLIVPFFIFATCVDWVLAAAGRRLFR